MNIKSYSDNLINKYSDMIYRIAIGYLKNKEDAEDIVQEVFLKYLTYIEKKKFKDQNHEKYWLIRVAINLCCNELKNSNNKNLVLSEKSIVNYFNLDEKNYFILENIEKLEEKYRVVFDLFYLRDLKISEISKILKISEVNVKMRLRRAREKLKKSLNT